MRKINKKQMAIALIEYKIKSILKLSIDSILKSKAKGFLTSDQQ